ncbi:MAG: DNA repair protein RecN [Clostridiales bacterium]|nr:DNA repair protein RecN [Clostridiales bacterium]
MLSRLSIKNFAIIKGLEAEFFPGFSVITGETGAGKSIVIEAMSMALGGRADKSMVRAGMDRAVITLVTDGDGIPEVLTREIGAAGKALCRADGEIVTLTQLEAFTAGHVDVHGQYDHQSLLLQEKHIGLLDAFGHKEIAPAEERTAAAFGVYRDAKRRLDEARRGAALAERELDFLRYEIKEIDDARLVPGEDEELVSRIRIMQSSEKIYEALAGAYGLLSGEREEGGAALAAVGGVRDSLAGLSGFDGRFARMAEVSAEAYYALEELETQVRNARDEMDFSQADLDRALSRLDHIERLKSKYGGSIEAVQAQRERAAGRIESAENSEELKAGLAKELASAESVLFGEARTLSALRKEAAGRLEATITKQLVALNFMDAEFSVSISQDDGAVSETGIDRVEFMLSANKGQPLLPLAKVASGGELSRIMLAFKSVTGDFDGIETMVFDEIDSGISGATASIVGEKLSKMSGSHQIICITHLAQIAAFADHHYILEKNTDGDETFTTLREISGEARVDEVARLVGGLNLTEAARENARELIRNAKG